MQRGRTSRHTLHLVTVTGSCRAVGSRLHSLLSSLCRVIVVSARLVAGLGTVTTSWGRLAQAGAQFCACHCRLPLNSVCVCVYLLCECGPETLHYLSVSVWMKADRVWRQLLSCETLLLARLPRLALPTPPPLRTPPFS